MLVWVMHTVFTTKECGFSLLSLVNIGIRVLNSWPSYMDSDSDLG